MPANTTSVLQPCDQGIIRTLKAYYRREMRAKILNSIDDGHTSSANELAKMTNLLDAIHLIAMSWNNVTETTITNCFNHVFKNQEQEITPPEEQPPELFEQEFEDWISIDSNVVTAEQLTGRCL